ncbi:MAG: hypothetical protein ACLP5E_00510 [Streptosporangiaceae bacterium]
MTTLAGASTHTLFDAGGTVYSCGANLSGDLGDGTTANSTTPVEVAGLGSRAVVQLVASFANSGALLSDGTYYDWGYDGGRPARRRPHRPAVRRAGTGAAAGPRASGRPRRIHLGQRADPRAAP